MSTPTFVNRPDLTSNKSPIHTCDDFGDYSCRFWWLWWPKSATIAAEIGD